MKQTPNPTNVIIPVYAELSDREKVKVVAKELGYASASHYLRNRIRRDYIRLMRRQAQKGTQQ